MRRPAASGLLKLIGVTALALCASAPVGALVQTPAAAVPAAAASAAAVLGSSIRKPSGATLSGAPGAANNMTAPAASASLSPVAPAIGATAQNATSLSDSRGAEALAPPVTTAESVSAPAALATPAKARRRKHSGAGVQSASAKPDPTNGKGAKGDQESNGQESPFSSLQFSGNKGPIEIKSDALNLDYKGNVVTFRGHVRATQGEGSLTSDTLTVAYGKDFHEVKEMVADNNVRMSQGARWATGDHAVLDQAKHIVILTGSPVVHDGEDQVTGSKITVHLDTGKSEVEGARAVFFPKEQQPRDNKTKVAKSP